MTNLDKICYLKEAEKTFREPPNISLQNQFGLCNYFRMIYNLSPSEIKEILGNKQGKGYYTFCYSSEPNYRGRTQEYVYNHNRPDQYFERADWCHSEIKRLTN